MFDEVGEIVNEHVTDTATQDDADCHPQHEIIEVVHRHGCLATPQFCRAEEEPRITPADEDAEDIGEGVPADGEGPELDQHRVEGRIGDDKYRHCEIRFCGTFAPPRSASTSGLAATTPDRHCEAIRCRRRNMTQTSNRFFDEMARLMNDAAGVAQGVRREFDTLLRSQAERILRDLDVVKREEFEAVKEMARLAREEKEALKARIAALEAKPEKLRKKAKSSSQETP